MTKCLAITNSGAQCKRVALPGSDYCAIPKHQELPPYKFVEVDKGPWPSTEKVEKGSNQCGHVNRHAFSVEGIIENLECTKPKEHAGPHSAMQIQNDRSHDVPKLIDVMVEWLDLAGTPADEIVPDVIEPEPEESDVWQPQ